MMRNRKFQLFLAFAALLGCLAGQARAEYRLSRTTTGNSVGWSVRTGWGGAVGAFTFPAGTKNSFSMDGWAIGLTITRDLSVPQDGIPEDTMNYKLREVTSEYAGLDENRMVAAIGASLAAGNLGKDGLKPNTSNTFSLAWTSREQDNLDSWPWEGRFPMSASGTPVIKGVETLISFTGDQYYPWITRPVGYFAAWSVYLLNFRETSNMVFLHIWMWNSSMYFKYDDTQKQAGKMGALFPDGVTWKTVGIISDQRSWSSSVGYWAIHPAKQIIADYFPGIKSTWTPVEPPRIGWFFLRPFTLRGETARITNTMYNCSAFGVSMTGDMVNTYTMGQVHRIAQGLIYPKPGTISPWTGAQMIGMPGMLQPTDTRYNQWIWSGTVTGNQYTLMSVLHDMAPRDSIRRHSVHDRPGQRPADHPAGADPRQYRQH